jgi:hypothetical protein
MREIHMNINARTGKCRCVKEETLGEEGGSPNKIERKANPSKRESLSVNPNYQFP